MDKIPDKYTKYSWVEAYPEASREEYERMLQKGDLAICATEYDTLARTWFEQAASGQVLIIRDEPWIQDCVPDNSPLVAPVDCLLKRTRWAVEHWDKAVTINRQLVEHVREVRSPERAGQKTLDDMVWRVEEKIDKYAEIYGGDDPPAPIVGRAIDRMDAKLLALDELNEYGARITKDKKPLLSHKECSITDLVFSLRVRGYSDTGNPGTPVFRRTLGKEPDITGSPDTH